MICCVPGAHADVRCFSSLEWETTVEGEGQEVGCIKEDFVHSGEGRSDQSEFLVSQVSL